MINCNYWCLSITNLIDFGEICKNIYPRADRLTFLMFAIPLPYCKFVIKLNKICLDSKKFIIEYEMIKTKINNQGSILSKKTPLSRGQIFSCSCNKQCYLVISNSLNKFLTWNFRDILRSISFTGPKNHCWPPFALHFHEFSDQLANFSKS